MRQRFFLFVLATVLFLGGAFLSYAQKSGQLSIFADAPVVPGMVSVTNPIDLQKGITNGDGNLVLNTNKIELKKEETGYAKSGRCLFDIGSPQVTQFFRFSSQVTTSLPAGTAIAVSFASSLDGISFGTPTAPIQLTGVSAQTIDLEPLVEENAHFLRITCTLLSTDSTVTPSFGGFSLDYNALPAQTPAATSWLGIERAQAAGEVPVTINGTLPGEQTETRPGSLASQSRNLVSTGIDPLTVTLVASWLGASSLIFTWRRSKRG